MPKNKAVRNGLLSHEFADFILDGNLSKVQRIGQSLHGSVLGWIANGGREESTVRGGIGIGDQDP